MAQLYPSSEGLRVHWLLHEPSWTYPLFVRCLWCDKMFFFVSRFHQSLLDQQLSLAEIKSTGCYLEAWNGCTFLLMMMTFVRNLLQPNCLILSSKSKCNSISQLARAQESKLCHDKDQCENLAQHCRSLCWKGDEHPRLEGLAIWLHNVYFVLGRETTLFCLIHQKHVWSLPTRFGYLRLEKAPVTMSGALRDDSTGAHGFFFLRRKGPCHNGSCYSPLMNLNIVKLPNKRHIPAARSDLPAEVQVVASGPGRLDWGESVNDVVCCIKRYASDGSLSQD